MSRVRRSSLAESIPLEGWALALSTAAGPDDLPAELPWLPIAGPMPVAAALRGHGMWSLEQPRDFDSETWWYRCRIPRIAGDPRSRLVLRIGGLATLADVFVDGQHVLRSENMFHEHRIDLSQLVPTAGRMSGTYLSNARASNAGAVAGAVADPHVGAVSAPVFGSHDVLLRFGPVTAALAVKRPRPRWKTKLVREQQLRYVRTTLLGRMPGWSPPVAPVGPWRPLVVERWSRLVVQDVDVRTHLDGNVGVEEAAATVAVTVRATNLTGDTLEDVVLAVGEHTSSLEQRVDASTGEVFLFGSLTVPNARLWWPHTHGDCPRCSAKIALTVGGARAEIDLGLVAFRRIELETGSDGDRFALRVNGAPVFCRGASWTALDVATLGGAAEDYARVLGAVKEAGMNMVRLSGTMFYEADAFYDACDGLGILVWQDFMFANMDYPIADDVFRASVAREIKEILCRLQGRPCVAVLCGGSEVEQQAAMFGAAREIWRGPLFAEVLPEACAAQCPDVPYWPNSPSGGPLPFHVDRGVAHYYGVGAYLRPLDDARRANVRFAAECLTFANVPEDDLFPAILRDGEAPIVSARWKERTSRDYGASWDFEDVRDHYVRLLFGIDPARLRYEDVDRYLALARVATGEVMARTFGEFRRLGSTCAGALVWFLQDLWPGAGWGVLDSRGVPKSPYWFLKRALQPLAVFVTDEGLNGLYLHAVNDGPADVVALLSLALYRDGEIVTISGTVDVVVPARGAIAVAGDEILGAFTDSARAYRFGPPGHDVAVAALLSSDGATLAEAVHLPDFGAPPPCFGLEASLDRSADGVLSVTVRTRCFAHAVKIAVPGYVAADNYFDLAPGRSRTIALQSRAPGTPIAPAPSARLPAGELTALNLASSVRLALALG